MTYDFTLDKKGIISLLAGSAVLGVLLFAAGWIVGMYWITSPSGASAPAARITNSAGSEQAGLPREPVLRDDPLQTGIAPPGNSLGTARPEIAQPSGVTGPAKQPGAALAHAANSQVPTAPPADAEEKLVQMADPEPPVSTATAASPSGTNTAVNPTIFTVQVGVFLEQNEASRLINAMEEKGYAPSFFADRDSENRQWYAVRLGAYADKNQAAIAAANFTKQEKIKAVVRPLGSL
jgi:septal ring-binding cell division protein DamX